MALLLADLPGVEQVELDSPGNVGDAWLAGPAGRPSRDWFDGRPKNAWFFSLSGTSVVEPSIETTRSPQPPRAPRSPRHPSVLFSLEAPVSRRGLPGRGRNAVLDRREP